MEAAPQATRLLAPARLGDLDLSNRLVMAPLTRARAGATREANGLMATHYAQRADAGLIVSEATTVSAQGNGWVGSPGIYTEAQAKTWRKVTDGVHEAGGRIFLQLWHTGRASHSDFHGGRLPVAPSPIRLEGSQVHTPAGKKDHEVPRALDTEELPGLVADYRAAARRAREAGFDGVEIHAANGYLLDTFLQSRTNHRRDAYGGSVANRTRLLLEVVEAVCEEWPARRVGVRLAPNGVFNDMGSPDYRETFLHVAAALDVYGLGYLHVMDGLGFGFHDLGSPMTLPEFRAVTRTALMGNCGYDREAAEAALVREDADLIAMGRPFIANPDLVARFANDWPLAPEAPPATWYSGEMTAVGYTDWPTYEEQTA